MGMSLVLSSPQRSTVVCTYAQRGQSSFWVLRVHFFACLACMPLVFILPESHGPTILARRARELRQQRHVQVFTQEELEHSTLWDAVHSHSLRPASVLFHGAMASVGLTQSHRDVHLRANMPGSGNLDRTGVWNYLVCSTHPRTSFSNGGIYSFFFEVYPIVFIEQVGRVIFPIKRFFLTYVSTTYHSAFADSCSSLFLWGCSSLSYYINGSWNYSRVFPCQGSCQRTWYSKTLKAI